MKTSPFWSTPCLFIELGQSSLRVLDRERGLDLPLERQDNGRLTASCKERVVSGLRAFLKQRTWGWRQRVVCALSARGVSLRRMTLPGASREELRRLLALQLEREFPLPPEALAWSCCPVRGPDSAATQEWLVAALKRDVLQEYTQILAQSGLNPVFTLAAQARTALCPQADLTCTLLDIGRCQSELISVEQGNLTAARILPWGGENITRAIQTRFGISRDEAEKLKTRFCQSTQSNDGADQAVASCFEAEAESLAVSMSQQQLRSKIFLSGETARCGAFVSGLAKAFGSGVPCEPIEVRAGAGRSAATVGQAAICERNGADVPLAFQVNGQSNGEALPRQTPARWATLACGLLLALLVLRYGEAFLRQPRLARSLAQINSQREGLPSIDREASFLQFLETNQPPFLDTLFLVANAAPTGARLDSLSMTRRGDFSLRGSMASAEQSSEFRSKLVDSGFFTSVVLDEQAPTPDRQKVTFRLTVQLKPHGERPPLPAVSAPKDAKGEKAGGTPANSSAAPRQSKVHEKP